ncbi:DEAD/DEAH box helicase [soil metagenome]
MNQDFAESGLSEPIQAAARAAGYERLTPLQAASLPVLRRGGSVVLHASSGAGVTAAIALPLLDRLAEGQEAGLGEEAGTEGPRALVLAPTPQRAESTARAMAGLAGATGLAVRTAAAGWRAEGADVLVTTADQALRDVQASTLKLGDVNALVLMDLGIQLELEAGPSLDALVPLVPRDAQRVVTSGELNAAVEAFIEAHVRRALTVPSRPADPRDAQAREAIGQIGYLVTGEMEKAEMLARLIDDVDADAVVYVRGAARAERVRGELGQRGIRAAKGATIRVVDFGHEAVQVERALSYDVPFSAEDLRRLHEGGGTVFVTPAELAHFMRIAREVPFVIKQRRARELDAPELDAFRDSVRSALDAEDLSAQLLVLEPLFAEHSPAEIAAALSALLRRREPAQTSAAAAPQAGEAPKDASTGGLTRLFVSIGSRDNVRPGDLVGAITGEAGIRGEQVGRVDIRESFSVVEVESAVADRVIRALNGTTMRGRSLRVDYDRKGTGGGEGGGRGPGGRGPRPAGGSPTRRRPPPKRPDR